MDLDAPPVRREPGSLAREAEKLERVQRWVMSTLAAITITHLAIGLVVLSLAGERDLVPQVGLCVLACVVGVLAVGVAFLIHGRSLLSPWLLVGLLPGLFGLWQHLG